MAKGLYWSGVVLLKISPVVGWKGGTVYEKKQMK